MSNRTLLYIAIALLSILLLVLIGLGAFLILNKEEEAASDNDNEATEEEDVDVVTTSEQPDMAKFNEFLSDAELGKLALGVEVGPPFNMPEETDEFVASTDQFCVSMTAKKIIPANSLSTVWYSVDSQADIGMRSILPQAIQQGGTSGCETIANPAGKYEYKIYIDDVLVADIPFEVE